MQHTHAFCKSSHAVRAVFVKLTALLVMVPKLAPCGRALWCWEATRSWRGRLAEATRAGSKARILAITASQESRTRALAVQGADVSRMSGMADQLKHTAKQKLHPQDIRTCFRPSMTMIADGKLLE